MKPRLHPLNAALRFALELATLYGLGAFGFACGTGALRYACALLLPLLAASAWGVFSVPGDPSRGKTGPVPVSGRVRLLLEALFFGAGAAAFAAAGHAAGALAFSAGVCAHYALAHARTRWLLTRDADGG